MKRKSKRNIIISSALALALSLSIATGATYALFTSEATTNIAITSGRVDVSASISELSAYSPKSISSDGTIKDDTDVATNDNDTHKFYNGGSAVLDGGDLTLTNMTPGDKVTFKISITNNSTVSVKYRTKILTSSDTGLFDGLSIKIGEKETEYVSDWTVLQTSSSSVATLDCSVELPTTSTNSYQNKSCTISYSVEAVQGNTYTEYVTVTPDNAQSVLNSDISNKTLYFTKGNYDTLYIAPTASASSDTRYFNCAIDYQTLVDNPKNYTYTSNEVTDLSELKSNNNRGYIRTIENTTFIGAEDVNIESLVAVYNNSGSITESDASRLISLANVDTVLSEDYLTASKQTKVDSSNVLSFNSWVVYSNLTFINLSFKDEVYLGDWQFNPDNFRVSDITISNCHFYSDTKHALQIGAYYGYSLGDITISNSTFETKEYYTDTIRKEGIYIKNATGNFNIKNNIFKNCSYNGIQVTEDNNHYFVYTLSTKDPMPKLTMVITGNTFTNIYDRPLRFGGCYEAGSTILVEDNIIYSPTGKENNFIKFGTADHAAAPVDQTYTYSNMSKVTVSLGTNTFYDKDGQIIKNLTVSSDTQSKYFVGCVDKQ